MAVADVIYVQEIDLSRLFMDLFIYIIKISAPSSIFRLFLDQSQKLGLKRKIIFFVL
jgi:hypothetical protein